MTDAEAEEMLKTLSKHFGQPVMPIDRYCDALRTWSEVAGNGLFWAMSPVMTSIQKSNLLRRLLYQGEKVRTVKCPTHQGRWSGYVGWDERCACQSGYDLTGWLPEPSAPDAAPPGVQPSS